MALFPLSFCSSLLVLPPSPARPLDPFISPCAPLLHPPLSHVHTLSRSLPFPQNRVWGELRNDSTDQPTLPPVAFLKKYPQRTPITDVSLPPVETTDNLWLDIQPYMNPTPFILPPHAMLPRCFRLFRSMGLRHIPIIDEDGALVGIITRAELTSFKMHEMMHAFDEGHLQGHHD